MKNTFRKLMLVCLLALLLISIGTLKPIQATAGSVSDSPLPTDQIIVKYKAGSAAEASPMQALHMQHLAEAAGTALTYLRPMSDDANVLSLPQKLPLDQVQAISRNLMALPDVEYAEPDQILRPLFTPNDPRYSAQWDLFDTWGINAPAAWDITKGSSSIVVADIDTGITVHPDLTGRILPGYDFISDVRIANDGNGRDNNPSDPGDWITLAESTDPSSYFYGCPQRDSSWHGTHTAGTIGASGNNSTGVAGINWISKILPVRVLGKCGGYTSDISDGMRWAAGLPVTGVPLNSHPARVMNISLGGPGSSCGPTWQNAINAITSKKTVVVVAAGNSWDDASGFVPANCNRVITVAATDKTGSRSYYSNYGSTVEISAPGGAQSVHNDPNGILSTLNKGKKGPASPTYVFYQGTSMAAPHVTGVVSLMLSVNPSLTPAQVLTLLQSTAKAFPGGMCDLDPAKTCGSGILDAGAAVNAVISVPIFNAVPATGSYGVVKVGTTSAGKTFTVRNVGHADMNIGAVTLVGANSSEFNLTGDACSGLPMHPNDTCTLTASFNPASTGAKTASINIPDDAGNPDSIPLSGLGGTELSVNGGFNTYTGLSKVPYKWVASNFSSTDGKDATNKQEGAASLKMANTSVHTKTMTQTRYISGSTGNTFQISLWVKGQSIPSTAGLVQAQVLLYHGSTLVQTNTISFGNGTYSWTQKSLTFTAPGAYNKVVIKLTYSKAHGSVWFDGVSLLRSP